jgi:hypothetical protein
LRKQKIEAMKARLTNEAIWKIQHPKNKNIKKGLEKVLEINHSTVWYTLKINDWNGHLTKEVALRYLEQELRMTRAQMLEIEDNE